MRQPIEFRIIGTIIAIAIALALTAFTRNYLHVRSHPLQSLATQRIQQRCAMRAECKLKLGDLFEGDWDAFHMTATPRALTLTRAGAIVAQEREPQSNAPQDGDLIFLDSQRNPPNVLTLPPDTWLWATAHTSGSTTYYVLTPDDR